MKKTFFFIERECFEFKYCQYTLAVWRVISNTLPLYKKSRPSRLPSGNLSGLGCKLPQGAYFPTHPSSWQCIIATSREWVSWLKRRLAIRLNQPWWKLLMFYCWCYKACYCWVVVVEMMMLAMLLTATQSIRVTADGSWRLVGISTFSTFTSCPAPPHPSLLFALLASFQYKHQHQHRPIPSISPHSGFFTSVFWL